MFFLLPSIYQYGMYHSPEHRAMPSLEQRLTVAPLTGNESSPVP